MTHKGIRPSRHFRNVRTKKGRKKVLINPHISKKIKVPPSWKKVKFYEGRNYLATGVDTKGRLQYLYPKNVRIRNERKKFRRVERLAKKKKHILNKVIQDAKEGNIEAQAVYTMFQTGFRPGTEKDTKADKEAFGTVTLLKDHVKVKPKNKVEFKFVGKKGVNIKKEIKDPLLADIIKERKQSKQLFDTSSNEVRDYFDKKTSGQFQLKDIRTLKAFEVADEILDKTKSDDPREIKKEVVTEVSEALGNTPAIAAQAYIAPKLEKLKEDSKNVD